jgi:solute carrier family 25 protein 39/40
LNHWVATSALFSAPFELARTQMQQKQSAPVSLKRVFVQVYQSTGWIGLWRGFVPTLYRDVPFSGMYWTGYEFLHQRIRSLLSPFSSDTSDDNSRSRMAGEWMSAFVSGAVSGSVAATITAPFDVAKTRRQILLTTDMDKAVRMSHDETSLHRILVLIYRNEGWSGLFAGLSARVAKVAPSCAIMISTYELGKLAFEVKKNK